MTDYAKFKDYVPNYLEINKSGLDTVKPTKEYLLIPFDKKDEIKKDYPIKWDVAKKLWYFDTVTPYYSKETLNHEMDFHKNLNNTEYILSQPSKFHMTRKIL